MELRFLFYIHHILHINKQSGEGYHLLHIVQKQRLYLHSRLTLFDCNHNFTQIRILSQLLGRLPVLRQPLQNIPSEGQKLVFFCALETGYCVFESLAFWDEVFV